MLYIILYCACHFFLFTVVRELKILALWNSWNEFFRTQITERVDEQEHITIQMIIIVIFIQYWLSFDSIALIHGHFCG